MKRSGKFSKYYLPILAAFIVYSGNVLGVNTNKHKTSKVKVIYSFAQNGKINDSGAKTVVIATPATSKTFVDNGNIKLIPETPVETSFIDYANSKTFRMANLASGEKIYTEAAFTDYPTLQLTGETEKILGYNCSKAKAVLRSNSIEIWYTSELNVKGTPRMSYGIADGLVLKIVRNGNAAMIATHIEILNDKKKGMLIPDELGEKVDLPLYRFKLSDSFVTTVTIFNNEQISWGNPAKNPKDVELNKTYHFAGGTVIAKRVKLPEKSSDYQVFAELEQYSNGDAYDRTGSIFLIPEDKQKSFFDALVNGANTVPAFTANNGKQYFGTIATPNFSPAVELVRFFTPFGINYFNDKVQVYGQEWEDKTFYKQDISELLPILKGEVWIAAFIGNYDKGGHKISLKLKYYPENREIESHNTINKPWIYPLFNTLNSMEMAGQDYATMFESDSLSIDFEVPADAKNIYLRYITTGHGGWGGGDEFNKKVNSIFIDNVLVHSLIPWKCNCGVERKYNPASGNFWNGISSSDYSRSGWCPGEASNPVYIPLNNLRPGKHTLKVAIPMGKKEGNSFSSWNVSGVLIGEI
ncbi:MAG: hypothetical protein J7L95_05760 [Prolixibacteraceae bacterium]|nr:hypothetical protein [Prolixibacteraceae bacterium]